MSLIGFHRFNFWRLTFNCITSAVCVSIIVGLAAYLTDSLTYWGGYFGYYVNDYLTTLGGYWAAIGVSIFLVAVLCVIFYEFLAKVIRTIARWIKTLTRSGDGCAPFRLPLKPSFAPRSREKQKKPPPRHRLPRKPRSVRPKLPNDLPQPPQP